MSDDEKKQELAAMLLEQHSLRQTIACLENRQERYRNQVRAASNLLEHGVVPSIEVELPSGEQVATLLRDLTEAQAALQRLEDRLSRT